MTLLIETAVVQTLKFLHQAKLEQLYDLKPQLDQNLIQKLLSILI